MADPLDTQHTINTLLEELPPEIKILFPDSLPSEKQLTWLVNAKKAADHRAQFKPMLFDRNLF